MKRYKEMKRGGRKEVGEWGERRKEALVEYKTEKDERKVMKMKNEGICEVGRLYI